MGPSTAMARLGPVTAHVSTLAVEPRSSAMSASDTVSTVMVKLAVNTPSSDAASTTHGPLGLPDEATGHPALEHQAPRDDGDLLGPGRLEADLELVVAPRRVVELRVAGGHVGDATERSHHGPRRFGTPPARR